MTTLSNSTLDLLIHSDTAVRLGIANEPNEEELEHLRATAAGILLVQSILERPVSITSGFRCEELERVICAKDFGAWCQRNHKMRTDPQAWKEYFQRKGHPKGWCVDFVSPLFGPPQKIVESLVAHGLQFDQLIMEGTWVHISFDPRMRGQVIFATFHNGVPSYQRKA